MHIFKSNFTFSHAGGTTLYKKGNKYPLSPEVLEAAIKAKVLFNEQPHREEDSQNHNREIGNQPGEGHSGESEDIMAPISDSVRSGEE